MKTKAFIITILIAMLSVNLSAQEGIFYERHGGTLNLGVGIGGYDYYYHTSPVFNVNYEFGVARNFTLAPFATIYSYADANYRETVIPIGVKGTIYLDQLLRAGSNWDFYTAGSLGFSLVTTTWDANYPGDRTYYHEAGPLYLDFHLGTEYHLSRNLGIFLDLSTAVSTIGIAIH